MFEAFERGDHRVHSSQVNQDKNGVTSARVYAKSALAETASGFSFLEFMTGFGSEVEPVDFLQLSDGREGGS